jgi:hypothetical protein
MGILDIFMDDRKSSRNHCWIWSEFGISA